jgi:hypothetical protein
MGLLMVILGIMSVPSLGMGAWQRPHCAQHGTAIHVGHGVASDRAPSHGAPTWTRGTNHECSHCPASECAKVSPCASSTTTALSPKGIGMTGCPVHRVIIDLAGEQAASADFPPDTPPPQLIA